VRAPSYTARRGRKQLARRTPQTRARVATPGALLLRFALHRRCCWIGHVVRCHCGGRCLRVWSHAGLPTSVRPVLCTLNMLRSSSTACAVASVTFSLKTPPNAAGSPCRHPQD
jgi:hypothetical protein